MPTIALVLTIIGAHHWCPPCVPSIALVPTIIGAHHLCPLLLVPTFIGAHFYWCPPLLEPTIGVNHYWCPPEQNVQNAILVNGTLQMANGTDAQNALAIGMPQELSNAFCF